MCRATKQVREKEETPERLHKLVKELEDLTQSKAKYKAAVDINANHVNALRQQLSALSLQYQSKLDSQSDKYKDSTEKTATNA